MNAATPSQSKIGSRLPSQAYVGAEFFLVDTILPDGRSLIGKWYKYAPLNKKFCWQPVQPEIEWIYRPGQQPEFVRHQPAVWW